MLQQEVAERIVAVPPDMSILAVSVQYYAEPRIIRTVKAGNFWPEPEIDSAIIQLDLKPQKLTPAEDKKFFQMVRIGFSAKRKMLKNNLAAGLRITPKVMENLLVEQDFDPKVRAEDLTLPDWYKLFAALTPFVV
jgi:16S rRNA (adenine1518-N6/adenine1519-N6)-dimethyltransferase